jgi:hypothetical protein
MLQAFTHGGKDGGGGKAGNGRGGKDGGCGKAGIGRGLRHIRICDQWGWILADIPIQMFVLKTMYMTDKLITDKHNVQTSHADDGLCEWVTV